jgi:hypothetical protein
VNRAGIALIAAGTLAAAGCHSAHHASVQRKAAERGTLQPAVASRDGNRIAVVRQFGHKGWIEVGPAGGGPRRIVFQSSDGCCDNVRWSSRYVLAFRQGSAWNVRTLDLRTFDARTIASGVYSFRISGDGRWIVWTQLGGDDSPDRYGLVSVTGHPCLLFPPSLNAHALDPWFHLGPVKRIWFLREPGAKVDSVPLTSLTRVPRCT